MTDWFSGEIAAYTIVNALLIGGLVATGVAAHRSFLRRDRAYEAQLGELARRRGDPAAAAGARMVVLLRGAGTGRITVHYVGGSDRSTAGEQPSPATVGG